VFIEHIIVIFLATKRGRGTNGGRPEKEKRTLRAYRKDRGEKCRKGKVINWESDIVIGPRTALNPMSMGGRGNRYTWVNGSVSGSVTCARERKEGEC